jgi:Domain of unknown function (DUF4276)
VIDILVEERSAAAALRILIPRIVEGAEEGQDFQIREFSGKQDLLKQLPSRLRAYANWDGSPKVLVLVDRDDQDCRLLKQQLESIATQAGLSTKSNPSATGFSLVNRIAVEELESWLLGDPTAIRTVFPKVHRTFEKTATFRDPDAISGGTAEALERLLAKAGYYSSLPKVEVANLIAEKMLIDRNTSASFHMFVEGFRALAN